MNLTLRGLLVGVTAAGLLLTAGCDKKDASAPEAKASSQTEAASNEPAPNSPSSPTPTAQSAVARAYDVLRAALADDKLPATQSAATLLAKVAESNNRLKLAELSTPISGAADLAVARLAFGDLSKSYIGLLSSGVISATGLKAYRCPMAKGYKKWIEMGENMANPYMGHRMLKCGGPTDMTP